MAAVSPETRRHRQRFDGFRFHDLAQKLAHTFVTNFLGFKAKRAKQEPLFEEESPVDSDNALQPCAENVERNQGKQNQSPCEQPAIVQVSGKHGAADEPPGYNQEEIFGGMSNQQHA